MTSSLIMEVSRLSVIPDSDEGAWSGNHGICLVLGRIFPSIEIDFFVFCAKARLFFYRFDALGAMSSVLRRTRRNGFQIARSGSSGMTSSLIMEVSRLSVIPDSDEGAWSGNHGICLVLGLKLTIVSLTMSLVRSRR